MVSSGGSQVDLIERHRLETQQRLDSTRTQTERNRLGQFATPTVLATDILEYAKTLTPAFQRIRFLDPAFGTGAFYAALLRSFPLARVARAWGYEVDPHYGQESKQFWAKTPLELEIADFTQLTPPATDKDKANLLICNPPYVRHHHLSVAEKSRLQGLARQISGIRSSGLAGLYCYFLLISHGWIADGGLAGWLIPSEFMDVNYGRQIKQYLLQQVTLLRVHRFDPDDVQFGDALVSSALVWFRKEKPAANHEVEFSYGGTLTRPEVSDRITVNALRQTAKWTRFPKVSGNSLLFEAGRIKLSDLFTIKRGLATGANKFFILTPDQVAKHKLPGEFLAPILPSPRYLTNEVQADVDGNPITDPQLFLLACNLPASDVKARYPSLWTYLQIGKQKGIDQRYLCRHRSPWYAQENRPASPFLCTYMGRQGSKSRTPFRFILNHSRATAPNVYLMLYPKPALERKLQGDPNLLKAVWQILNEISPELLMGEGRVYGGGLHKIEPGELSNAPADGILTIFPGLSDIVQTQLSLFDY